MIVKMKLHYQDAHVHYSPNQEVEVGTTLGNWLIANKMAVAVEQVVAKYLNVEPQFEQAEEPPQPKEFKNAKRGRRQS